ncbi:hypothetical protein FA260_33335 [Pseudomonas aeruginosa]|nr:hypothetical protein [Pseudomonas aeruginosa]
MSIDWNTAPEGATHWEPAGPEFNEGWMKKEGNGWFFWGLGAEWKYGGDVSAEREATFEARPQEAWDGQGLPPVGTNCEYRSNDRWLQCEVVAHRNNAAVVLNHHYEADFVPPQDLRPIRTPEQIAAEEREKAIEEMCFAEETLTVKQAKALYEAGYRRQEEGK